MQLTFRRFSSGSLLALILAVGVCGPSSAASPDFYGIKMNSENHARDLAPDELALFPVRRGFDKNIYAYAHLETAMLNHSRSIRFNVFNNTDNDILTERDFREYYVVLRNGERYRLNEPMMTGNTDRIRARGSAALRADFGQLNVTKEQIEMVVCSFDMGKVKIVLLPIAQEPPAPLPAGEAEKLTKPRAQKDPAGVYSKDAVEPRAMRGENEIRAANEPKRGRFPVMDLPIFSWLKNASSHPAAEIRGASAKSEPVAVKPVSAPKTNIVPKSVPAPAKSVAAAPEPAPLRNLAEPAAEETKKPERKGLFGSLASIFSPRPRGASDKAPAPKSTAKTGKSSPAAAPAEKEFFWKPRDLDPIEPIGSEKAPSKKTGGSLRSEINSGKGSVDPDPPAANDPASRPFYMPRHLDPSAKIPSDDPVTAVSSPSSRTKAPVLKPEKKLRQIAPRQDARVVQVNRQMGFIIVNAGSMDGVRENAVLNIYRAGKIVGKAVVRRVDEDASAALLLKEWARTEIAVGDPVSFF